jgi:hypothetical protein
VWSEFGSAQHGTERLQRRPHDVVVRLLRGERHPGGLRVETQLQRAFVARAESVPHDLCPDLARRAVLGDLLEKSLCALKKNDRRGTKSSTSRPASTPYCTYSMPSRSVKASSCRAVAAGLADVVPADRNRVPARDFLSAELEDVRDETHRRTRRENVFLLRDEFLEDVVLNRA